LDVGVQRQFSESQHELYYDLRPDAYRWMVAKAKRNADDAECGTVLELDEQMEEEEEGRAMASLSHHH
jgi:hypothetical protein